MATNPTPETVLLRSKIDSKSQAFEPAHAERLLAYKGTVWEKAGDEVSGDGTGKKLPAASNTEKTAPAATGK